MFVVLCEGALAYIMIFATFFYEMAKKRKKLTTGIAIAILLLVSLIISLVFNMKYYETFEMDMFLLIFPCTIILIFSLLIIILMIIQKREERKSNMSYSNKDRKANEFVKQIFGDMYADGKEDKKRKKKINML